MPAIRQTGRFKTPAPQPIVFTLIDSGESTDTFKQGECICKNCKSTNLDFSPYLEDAKCTVCGQWQNEEPLSE